MLEVGGWSRDLHQQAAKADLLFLNKVGILSKHPRSHETSIRVGGVTTQPLLLSECQEQISNRNVHICVLLAQRSHFI